MKQITDDDDDVAHENNDADQEVQFYFADKQHAFMVDKILLKNEGVTHDVWKDEEPTPVDDAADGGDDGDTDNDDAQSKVEE